MILKRLVEEDLEYTSQHNDQLSKTTPKYIILKRKLKLMLWQLSEVGVNIVLVRLKTIKRLTKER